MRVSDKLFFAPNILFSQLALDAPDLVDHFRARIEGYYLLPARRAAEAGDGFAAGLLVVAAIDALSKHEYGPNRATRKVRQDFELFAAEVLPSFATKVAAHTLFADFRNGLVHEARLKNGAQFALNFGSTLGLENGLPVIDPLCLVVEVHQALTGIMERLRSNPVARAELANSIRREFEFELR